MARSGEHVTYRELEARANRLAHLLRALGLKRLDHIAVFMENHPRYVECGAAGERSGLYYTNVNSYLTARELAYIVNNSQSQVLITSQARRASRARGAARMPGRRTLPDRRRARRGRRASAISTRRRRGLPYDADRGRVAGRGDALFLRHDRQSEGRSAAAAGAAAVATRRRSVQAFCEHLAVSARADLSHAGAALPFGAVGAASRHDLASAAPLIVMEHFDEEQFLRLIETAPRHSHAARADDVLAPAEAAAGGARAATTSPRWRRRSRRRALSRPGQAGDDRLVGADHP